MGNPVIQTPHPRYQIHDEDGLLRAFWTRHDAESWMLPGMRLVVLPRPPRKTRRELAREAMDEVGEAIF